MAYLVNHAQQALSVIRTPTSMHLYVEVDFVRNSQGFALKETELIEPWLYFNIDEQSVSRFAQAFVVRM